MDATTTWPFPQGSVKYVFADNVVEHLDLEGVRLLLARSREAMAPGGVIRLATPDVQALVEIYQRGRSEAFEDLRKWHEMGGRSCVYPADILRIAFTAWGHAEGYLFDYSSLFSELRAAGFHNIRRCAVGDSAISDLRGLESRVDAEAVTQLVIEAEAR
jgi:predicted SAM-dependent methyltransferase